MKKGFIIFGIVIVLVVVSGCTQSAVPSQPIATVTTQTSIVPTSIPSLPTQTTNLVSENTVRINDFTFEPANISIKAGSIVRWVNGDAVLHRIQFDDEHFSQILLGSSQSGSQRFVEPGVYPYICIIHPEMRGIITVVL